jgi:hypothetical protein
MYESKHLRWLPCLAVLLALSPAPRLSADVVEMKNGARDVGKVTSLHEGVVTIETEYAGEIKVKQAMVVSITTDHSVSVRLADGTDAIGWVASPAPGKLKITGATKVVECQVANVSAFWAAGQEDPDIVAKRRKWSYEAGGDVNGRTGTQRQLSTSYHYRAKLASPTDTFQYYTSYTRQEVNNQVSADQFKVGADYADNFTPTRSWYIRDEGGFDRVNFITLYDIAATGFGYDFIKQKKETLTARVGLSYRYAQYVEGKGASLSSAGADFGFEYLRKVHNAQFTDKLAFVPAFQDLGNFVVNHEFAFEMPIDKATWKLATGIANNYYSRPVGGADKLETLYFTRLILTWGAQPPGN